MSRGLVPIMTRARRYRVDADSAGESLPVDSISPRVVGTLAGLVLGLLFIGVGGASYDLGPTEARQALAAGEGFGPLGQAIGHWEPGLWPGRVWASQVWSLFVEGRPADGSVRWPEAIAGIALVVLAGRWAGQKLGVTAGVLAALTVGSCLAMVDRSAAGVSVLDAVIGRWVLNAFGSMALLENKAWPVVDLLAGLAIVATLERVISSRFDAWAGLLAAVAFLAGGWPALLVIALPMVVLGRGGPKPTFLAVAIVVATFVGWSIWTIEAASAQTWGAALGLPAMKGAAWTLPAWVIVYGLPWAPFAAFASSQAVRGRWTPAGRAWVTRWLAVGVACVVAGTVIPGVVNAARVPALFALMIVAAAAIDGALGAWMNLGSASRLGWLAITMVIVGAWVTVAVPGAGYLAAAVPYYRPVTVTLVGLSLTVGLVASVGLWLGRPGLLVASLVGVAIGLKLATFGVFAPEWNYRFGQGPWGRAVGQWVPRRATLYSTVAWPADLLLATGRPVRVVPSPYSLAIEPGPRPLHILLTEEEYRHWPAGAPQVEKIRSFEDQLGRTKVLVRTIDASAAAPRAVALADPEMEGSSDR